jgi:hypothetical protein
MWDFLEMFGWICLVVGAPIAVGTIVIIALCKIVNAIFGTSFGEYQPGEVSWGSSSHSSNIPSSSEPSKPYHREFFVREMGKPAQLYTSTDTAFGTVVNKYGAPPEEAVIINNFNKK